MFSKMNSNYTAQNGYYHIPLYRFYQLHQILQYGVIGDSKQVNLKTNKLDPKTKLISKEYKFNRKKKSYSLHSSHLRSLAFCYPWRLPMLHYCYCYCYCYYCYHRSLACCYPWRLPMLRPNNLHSTWWQGWFLFFLESINTHICICICHIFNTIKL